MVSMRSPRISVPATSRSRYFETAAFFSKQPCCDRNPVMENIRSSFHLDAEETERVVAAAGEKAMGRKPRRVDIQRNQPGNHGR